MRFGAMKVFFAFIALVVVLSINLRFCSFANVANKGGHIYQIEVHYFNQPDDIYFGTDLKIDSVTKNCTFIDGFGIKKTITGNYTISEY